jgi:plastocyanin
MMLNYNNIYMKTQNKKFYISLLALSVLVFPANIAKAQWYDSGSYYDTGSYNSGSWYDSGSYYSGNSYSNNWYDSGSYYDNSWYDTGSYYSNNWYDTGSYYDNSWYDTGSYYDNSWYDSGSYYDNSWYDTGSYYSNNWYDTGSYYDNSWYDSGSYYDNSWYDTGSYYSNNWYDTGSYYDNSWYDSGSYYDNNWGGFDPGFYDYSQGFDPGFYDYNWGYNWGFDPGFYDYDWGYNWGFDPGFYNWNWGYNWGFDPGFYNWNWDYNWTCYQGCDSIDPPPTPNQFNVSCIVSDRTIERGDSVTFTANASGGRGSYTYQWSGDISGTGRTLTRSFNTSGTYLASVRVTDADGRTRTANCDSVSVDTDQNDLEVSCRISETSINVGDSVRFTADVTGGNGSYTYRWTGDINRETRRTFLAEFSEAGRYDVSIEVRDSSGQIARENCSSIRVREDSRNTNINSSILASGSNTYNNPPSGNLASVNSVYLNQVPYTGPEDIAKAIAFIVGILLWSIIGALVIKNRMNKKAISNRIAAFKEANKATRM